MYHYKASVSCQKLKDTASLFRNQCVGKWDMATCAPVLLNVLKYSHDNVYSLKYTVQKSYGSHKLTYF